MSGLTDTQVDAVASAATRLVAALRAVVDVQAHGEPSPSPTGTSSAGYGAGSASPDAPSTETRQAAQDGQSGSGRDATDGAPAHQPAPQVGDVWERVSDGRRLVVVNKCGRADKCWRVYFEGCPDHWHHGNLLDGGRLVERDGKPWPPAQEPGITMTDPAHNPPDASTYAGSGAGHNSPDEGHNSAEPATDDQIASLERMLSDPDARPRDGSGISWHSARALLARSRQEQDRAEGWKGSCRDWEDRALDSERDRDEAVARAEKAEERASTLSQGVDWAVGEREEQIKRAEAAEAALARVERVTAAERAVVENARKWYLLPHEHDVDVELTELCAAVRALRDAQAVDQ